MENLIFPTLVSFLHSLFTVIWIGGLTTLGLVVMPTARGMKNNPQIAEFLNTVQRRLSPIIWISIAGLGATGVLLARREAAFDGLLSFTSVYSTALSVKHILFGVMVAVAVYRSVVVIRRGVRDTRLSGALIVLNLALGITVLFLSAYTTVI